MGILLKDQKVLYSDLNLGVIDDSGDVTPIDPTPDPEPTPRTLPSDAFAVYDKRTAPVETETDVYSWADQSGNSRPMTIEVYDSNDSPAALWNTDRLVCGRNLRSVCAEIPAAQGVFDPDLGYTMNMLIDYALPTGEVDDPLFKPNGGNSLNQLDILFSLAVQTSGGGTRNQHGLGGRYGNGSDCTELGANYMRMFYGCNASSAWDTKYSANQLASLTGLHLLTWTVDGTGTTCKVYYDGTLIDSFTLSKTMAGTEPYVYLFASHRGVGVSENIYNFFGDCYAVCIYNRVLSVNDIINVSLYYKENYSTQYSASVSPDLASIIQYGGISLDDEHDEPVAEYNG